MKWNNTSVFDAVVQVHMLGLTAHFQVFIMFFQYADLLAELKEYVGKCLSDQSKCSNV